MMSIDDGVMMPIELFEPPPESSGGSDGLWEDKTVRVLSKVARDYDNLLTGGAFVGTGITMIVLQMFHEHGWLPGFFSVFCWLGLARTLLYFRWPSADNPQRIMRHWVCATGLMAFLVYAYFIKPTEPRGTAAAISKER